MEKSEKRKLLLLLTSPFALFATVLAIAPHDHFVMYTREMAAQASLRQIAMAEERFHSTHGRYSTDLHELAAAACFTSRKAADLFPVNDERAGYRFTLRGFEKRFRINADPQVFKTTGSRTFYMNEPQTIHVHQGP